MGRFLPFSLSLVLGWVALSASADVAVLAPDKDNTLFEDASGGGQVSNGQGSNFFAGRVGSGGLRRGLVSFDIAGSLPPGATVTSVVFTLNLSATIVGATSVGLHPLLADWGEAGSNSDGMGGGGGGAAAATGDATWLHTFFDSDFWTTPGGDFSGTASATQTVADIGPYAWGSTPELVADVQSWLEVPGSNFGWAVLGEEGTGPPTAKRFVSREEVDMGLRPQLVIEFDPPVGMPAPLVVPTLSAPSLVALAMMIAAAGGILLSRRRRFY